MNILNLEQICAWKKSAEGSEARKSVGKEKGYELCNSCDGTDSCGKSFNCQNYISMPYERIK